MTSRELHRKCSIIIAKGVLITDAICRTVPQGPLYHLCEDFFELDIPGALNRLLSIAHYAEERIPEDQELRDQLCMIVELTIEAGELA